MANISLFLKGAREVSIHRERNVIWYINLLIHDHFFLFFHYPFLSFSLVYHHPISFNLLIYTRPETWELYVHMPIIALSFSIDSSYYYYRLSIPFLHLLVSARERNANTTAHESTIQNVIDPLHAVHRFLVYSKTLNVEEQHLSESNLIPFPTTNIVMNLLGIVMSKLSLVKHPK